jgi:hypothetical protein
MYWTVLEDGIWYFVMYNSLAERLVNELEDWETGCGE